MVALSTVFLISKPIISTPRCQANVCMSIICSTAIRIWQHCIQTFKHTLIIGPARHNSQTWSTTTAELMITQWQRLGELHNQDTHGRDKRNKSQAAHRQPSEKCTNYKISKTISQTRSKGYSSHLLNPTCSGLTQP